MANVSVYNIEGKEVGTIDLNDAVFGVEVNEHLLHMAVVNQLANKRQGTQKANHGDKKEQVMQDKVLQDLHNGQAVELYLRQHQETTLSN